MMKYANTVCPKPYGGSKKREVEEYRRQRDYAQRIGIFLDNEQSVIDLEGLQGRSFSFSEISETLRIPFEDVKALLWNRCGGGDCGITVWPSTQRKARAK